MTNFPRAIRGRWIDGRRGLVYRWRSMRFLRIQLLAAVAVLMTGIASAQIQVNLRLSKKSYLSGEPVPATITLTNLSGQDLTIRGSARDPWLDFIIKSNRGVPLVMAAKPAFGAVNLPAGRSVAKSVDLAQLYSLGELGNYTIYSIVRLPDQRTDGFQSNRHQFTISTARPYWSQVVGYGNDAREFRLLQFSGNRKTELYAQVAKAKDGKVVATHALGEVLIFRKPTVTVDGSLRMHVLYLVTPSIWGHVQVDRTGKFLGRDLYKNPDSGFPSLAKSGAGEVLVVGGIPYDPKAAAEAMKRTRKASERPDFAYPGGQ